MTPKELCTGRSSNNIQNIKTCLESLVNIVTYAYNMSFQEEPDYAYLRHMFVKILLERD